MFRTTTVQGAWLLETSCWRLVMFYLMLQKWSDWAFSTAAGYRSTICWLISRIEQTTQVFDSSLKRKKKPTDNEDQICTTHHRVDQRKGANGDKPMVNSSDQMWSCSLQAALLNNNHMNAAEGLNTECDNYLRCGSEAWYKWGLNSCCQFGCRIGPVCV